MPLFKGCKITISVTTKGKLRAISSNDPKDYVTVLMTYFFSDVEAANMTAEGRTKGSVRLDENIKDAIFGNDEYYFVLILLV